jgi:hypothetical protein
MKDQIDLVMQRAQRYWHIDGLAEISFGGVSLVLGIYFYLSATLAKGTLLSTIIDSSLILFMLAGAFLVNKVIRYIKQHVTYRRTGYVSYRRKSGVHRWVAIGLAFLTAFLMAAIVAGLMSAAPASLAWMPAITGLLLAIPFLILGFRSGSWRFYLLCLVSLLVGPGLSIAGYGDTLGLAYYYLLISLALFISGGLTFFKYLRTTTSPDQNSLSEQGLPRE